MNAQPSDHIALRAGTPDDREALCALHIRSWQRHYANDLPANCLGEALTLDMTKRWASRTFSWPELILVAETLPDTNDPKPAFIGFVCVLAKNQPPLIDNLHVDACWQSQGIGRALLQRVFELLFQRGFQTVELEVLESNTSARRFYAQMGGQDTGGGWCTLMGQSVAERYVRFDLIRPT